jgi:hypothetical protein
VRCAPPQNYFQILLAWLNVCGQYGATQPDAAYLEWVRGERVEAKTLTYEKRKNRKEHSQRVRKEGLL